MKKIMTICSDTVIWLDFLLLLSLGWKEFKFDRITRIHIFKTSIGVFFVFDFFDFRILTFCFFNSLSLTLLWISSVFFDFFDLSKKIRNQKQKWFNKHVRNSFRICKFLFIAAFLWSFLIISNSKVGATNVSSATFWYCNEQFCVSNVCSFWSNERNKMNIYGRKKSLKHTLSQDGSVIWTLRPPLIGV